MMQFVQGTSCPSLCRATSSVCMHCIAMLHMVYDALISEFQMMLCNMHASIWQT